MAYSLLIADDEYFIRQKLKRIIDYEGLDITLVADVENGQEVIDCLTSHCIDLLILDINMPFLSGLDVAKYIFDNNIQTEVIVLSGYADFEYAQVLMQYHVKNYILKPVANTTLHESLKKAIVAVNENRRQREAQVAHNYHTLVANVKQIISENGMITSLYPECPFLSPYPFCVFLCVHTNRYSNQFFIDFFTFLDTLDVQYVLLLEDNHILHVLVLLGANSSEFLQSTKAFLEQNIKFSFLAQSSVFSVDEPVAPYYKAAISNFNQRFFLHPKQEQRKITDFSDIRKNMIKNAHAGAQTLDQYMSDIICSAENYKHLNLLLNEVLFSFYLYDNRNVSLDIPELVQEILSENDDLDGIANVLCLLAKTHIYTSYQLDSDVFLCQKVVDYIETYFAESTISVATVATHVGLTPSYIGSIFKKVHKKSINQYITEFRLQSSEQLLMDPTLKISDIATMVGYTDAFYFSKRFKQFYGYSPKHHKQGKTPSL